MAIFFKDKEITSLSFGNKVISYVYYGGKLVWEAFRSCFDKGFWVNDQQWNNNTAWRNNK